MACWITKACYKYIVVTAIIVDHWVVLIGIGKWPICPKMVQTFIFGVTHFNGAMRWIRYISRSNKMEYWTKCGIEKTSMMLFFTWNATSTPTFQTYAQLWNIFWENIEENVPPDTKRALYIVMSLPKYRVANITGTLCNTNGVSCDFRPLIRKLAATWS